MKTPGVPERMFLATRSRKVAALLARRWREVRAWARALRHRMGTRAGIRSRGAALGPCRLPGPLVLSVIHAVGLALWRVTLDLTVSTLRYTRICLMQGVAQHPGFRM